VLRLITSSSLVDCTTGKSAVWVPLRMRAVGFGGLQCAKTLAHAPVEVTLIDQQNHHCFQPLLYQVATAALAPSDVAWPIRTIVRRQKNVQVVLALVVGVAKELRSVETDWRALPYDYQKALLGPEP
jgi:NADH dehydrogenase FAD-containing subunit